MARKVYVNVHVRLILDMEEGIRVDDVISDLDYGFKSQTDNVDIEDTEITGYDITDSK